MLRYYHQRQSFMRHTWKIPCPVAEVSETTNWKSVSSMRINHETLSEMRYFPKWKRALVIGCADLPLIIGLVGAMLALVQLTMHPPPPRTPSLPCMPPLQRL